MKRVLVGVLSAALVGVVAPTAHAAAWHTWRGVPTDVFRTGQFSHGEWIYTNGLWQAKGANTDHLERTQYYGTTTGDPTHIPDDIHNAATYSLFGTARAAHNGDYQLPTSLPDGTGEVAEVRLAAEGGFLYLRLLWNSFPDPKAQLGTVTFGSSSAAKAWPHNAGLSSTWSAAVTVWGTGADVVSDGGTKALETRYGNHTSETRIPLSVLPPGPWALHGGSGLADPANPSAYQAVSAGEANATVPGSGGPTAPTNVWDLLFAGDAPWSFDELAQSKQLTAGTVTASATVDPALLKGDHLAPLQHGDFTRLLHSKLPSKDGILRDRSGAFGGPSVTPPAPTPDVDVSYHYTGALQEYAMHVPASYDGSRATPLVLYLHGYAGSVDEPFYNNTGLVPAVDGKGWLFASLLGRGDLFYRAGGDGEADVLEVLADVERRYHVDRDRIYVMGHSMGGYGTNNLAAHHPDLFAAVAPFEGTDSADLYQNLRNTPWFEVTAEEDLDAQGKSAKALQASLASRGYEATLLDYQLKIHEYSSIYDTLPRLLGFFSAHRRASNPAIVTWTRPVGQDNPTLGQLYDGAWWLRGVTPAAGVTRPTVTVESMALPHLAPGGSTKGDTMVDEGGPTGRTRAELFTSVPSGPAATVVKNELRLTANGAQAARVLLAQAGLGGVRSLVVKATVDHAFALTLVSSFGSRTVQIPSGSQTLTVTW